jgi:hypothetical protein
VAVAFWVAVVVRAFWPTHTNISSNNNISIRRFDNIAMFEGVVLLLL